MANKNYSSKKYKKYRSGPRKGWDQVTDWYDGMVGSKGSKHHRHVAIPAVLEMLEIKPGEKILDIGCGPGVLAPHISHKKGKYTGVDISTKMIEKANERFGSFAQFIKGDATKLDRVAQIEEGSFDSAVFMLSIQDIEDFEAAISSAAYAVKTGGKIVLLMTHPAFRIPRQSGWGEDPKRKLTYRRIDSYLSTLSVPLRIDSKSKKVLTKSYHRPIHKYVNSMSRSGITIDMMVEPATYKIEHNNAYSKSEERAHQEIPLFLGIRGIKT